MHSPGFHAWFNLHCFVRARHHSHKHLSSLWVVLSLQVFIHTVLYVHSQSCRLQPFSEQTHGRNISNLLLLLTFQDERRENMSKTTSSCYQVKNNTSEITSPATETTKLPMQENYLETYAVLVQMEVVYITLCAWDSYLFTFWTLHVILHGKLAQDYLHIWNMTAATFSRLIH